jgi:type IV secretory pathway TrbF-like protein
MSPMIKRAITAVAAKKAWDRYQESRRPQRPSLWSRAGVPSLVVAAGGALVYLGMSGRLQPVVNQVRGKTGSNEGNEVPPPPPTI